MVLIDQTFAMSVQVYADLLLYYSDVYEHELKYNAIDQRCILDFLAELKNSKSRGKYYGVSHLSKFYDAIKCGSVLANQHLSTNLYS